MTAILPIILDSFRRRAHPAAVVVDREAIEDVGQAEVLGVGGGRVDDGELVAHHGLGQRVL